MVCEQCRTDFDGRPGQRFCSRPCRNGFHNRRRPGGVGPPRERRPRRPGRCASAGTQHWMTDPTVAACAAEACFWDRATCPTHRKT